MPHWHGWVGAATILLAVSTAAPGCAIPPATLTPVAPTPAAQPSPERAVDRIGYAQVCEPPSCLAGDVAQAKGFFAGEGIEIASQAGITTTAALMDAVGRGTVAIGAGSAEGALAAIERGADIVIVASYAHLPPYTLVAQSSITEVASLRGQSLVASSQVVGEAPLVKMMLGKAGLQYLVDYDIVVAGSVEERVAAIENGSVAAGLLGPPYDRQLLERGKKRLLTVRDATDSYESTVLVANRAWAEAHPDAVVRFLRADEKAMRWLQDPASKEEAIDILARQARLEPKFARSAFEAYVEELRILSADLKVDANGLSQVARAMVDGGVLRAPGNAPKALDLRYWETATGKPAS